MRNALVFITLLNSVVLMFCLSQAEVNELVLQPRRICGNHLPIAMRAICKPEVFQKLKTKKSLDFGESHKFEKAIDRMLAMYEDEAEPQSDEGGYGYDWIPNYVYTSQYNKRDAPTITQACCKNACTLRTMMQYCPRRN